MRFLLPTAALVLLALAGCASPQQKQARLQAKADRLAKQEDTRATEQRRMLAVEDGRMSSERGASILYPNNDRTFDPNSYTGAAVRGYNTKSAQSKGYDATRQFRVDTYQARTFADSKSADAAQRKFATTDASTKGKYLIQNSEKAYGTKTAATKESSDAHKQNTTRELADGHRPYLGKESQKVRQAINPKDLANWHDGQTVTYGDGEIEKVSSLKPLTVDDIRDLLNKSK
ncbi:MAG TPA: hypothetical protein VGM54_09080 [Chthoniobacter sp.]